MFKQTSLPLKKYILSFAAAFILTLVLQGILGVVFSFLPPPQKIADALCRFFSYFSAFIAALLCARSCGKRGFLTGMVCADTYMALLMLAGIILLHNAYDAAAVIRIFAFSSLCGIVGGIIGINCK